MIELIGKRVTLFCQIYIYTGKLEGVTETEAILSDAYIVYETGAFDQKAWKDAQKIGEKWSVKLHAIESFGLLK